jgi:hypothetical protein|nr:hypothetical protein [uncultured Flavobacterium sp.]
MTQNELYQNVIGSLNLNEIHPLHKAIIEECCESALESKQYVEDLETLKFAVQVSFITCLSALKGTISASLEFADTVTLNYRGQKFDIPKNSNLLK